MTDHPGPTAGLFGGLGWVRKFHRRATAAACAMRSAFLWCRGTAFIGRVRGMGGCAKAAQCWRGHQCPARGHAAVGAEGWIVASRHGAHHCEGAAVVATIVVGGHGGFGS